MERNQQQYELAGKSAIITGGSRGIGRSVAELFGQAGANLVLVYQSNTREAQEVAHSLQEKGVSVELFQGNVEQPATAEKAVALCQQTFGSVDILVNNAGMTRDKLLLRMEEETFSQVLDVNLKGSFFFLKEAASVMVKQRQGSIINVSSVVGLKGNPGQVNYSASKAGVVGMTKAAAKELGRRGIRVNAVAPGFIETSMTEVLTKEQRRQAQDHIPLGRLGKPEEVAQVALFLASHRSAYLTGQILQVDGGLIL